MVLNLIFGFIGAFTFLYFFWKKLKDDYSHNIIFICGFYTLFGIVLFSILGFYFAFRWLFWLALAGAFLGLLTSILRFRLRVFEVIEAWVFGSTALLFVFYFYLWAKTFQILDFIPVVLMFLLVFFYIFMDTHYKRFSWYKSGRLGFSGLATLGVVFLIRAVVAFIKPDMLFFVGRNDIILSGVVSFTAFLFLFNLSRSKQ